MTKAFAEVMKGLAQAFAFAEKGDLKGQVHHIEIDGRKANAARLKRAAPPANQSVTVPAKP